MTESPTAKPRVSEIMVVDDTPANLQLLTGMLKERGYKVRPVPNGRLALQAAKTNPPDLILLDINMPEMNGYQVCETLKSDAKLRDIPVIFISALNETMDKLKAFSLGGVDYVTKPFQLEEVHARVRTHLELERQKQELLESYAKLRELESLRDGLVHMIVHDMRNSLTGTYGFLDLVSGTETNLTDSGKEYVQRAMKSVQDLVEMISSLLDVSKMEANQMQLNRTECDLVRMTREVLNKLEALQGDRRISLNPQAETMTALADTGLLPRIIQNLLGNALKFTPSGGRIDIGIESREGQIRFSVTDTGPGIPREYQGRIFEKFGQVAGRNGNQEHSTGLGLTFCKLAVEAHGGSIGVDSEAGKGSTFWFRLPVE